MNEDRDGGRKSATRKRSADLEDTTDVPALTDEAAASTQLAQNSANTDRGTSHQALHESEQRLRAIVDTVADGIVTVDRQGVIRDFNPAAERIFGYPASEATGMEFRQLISPNNPEAAGDCLRPYLQKGEKGLSGSECELTGRRKDSSLFPIALAVTQIDHLKLYVALMRDLSERKVLEQQVIEVSTLEQERVGREIHDGIGQQLTALTMLASSLEHRLGEVGRPQEAGMARELATHLQQTLADTRALSRGLSPIEIDPEGLVDALTGLAELIQALSGIRCRLTGSGAVKVRDKFVAMQLYRIAQEALNNAVKHGKPENIEMRLQNENHGILLTIRDDGTGIAPTASRKDRIGLHIMRYRANIIGGRLTVVPAREGGTLVSCTIPGP